MTLNSNLILLIRGKVSEFEMVDNALNSNLILLIHRSRILESSGTKL